MIVWSHLIISSAFDGLRYHCLKFISLNKNFLLSLIMIIFGYTMCAQNYLDLVQASYIHTPLNRFDTSLSNTRVQDVVFNSTLPIKLNARTAIVTGLDMDRMHLRLTPSSEVNHVSAMMLKVGINHQFSEKWSGNFVALPRLASDFRGELIGHDFQLGGLVLLKYTKRSNFKYKFGFYANSELFGPFCTPIVGLYYKSPNDKFELDLSLPLMGDLNYRFYEKVFGGMRFQGFVRSYHLHDSYYLSQPEYLTKTTNELYTYLGVEPIKGLLIKANLGYSIGRHYRIYNIEDQIDLGVSAFRFGDDRKQLNTDFADGLLFRIDCVFRLYLADSE
jgi:hypothetical protein